MRNSSVNKFLVALAASGLVIASCASGSDEAAEPAAAEEPAAEVRSDDAEDSLASEPPAEEPADEPAEEPAATEAPAEAEPAAEPDAPAEEAAAEEPAAEEPQAQDQLSADAEEVLAAEPTTAPGEDADEESAAGGGLFGEEPPADRLDDNRFEEYGYRQFVPTSRDPLSTFALDVDTGSYTIARRWLGEGTVPPPESVRPEEYVNAFDYDYDAPRDGLEISIDGGPSPFDDRNYLVRVGVQAEIVDDRARGDAALTFVIDTSGSMDRDDRLGLVKESLTILVEELSDDDTVAIVTYSDSSGVVLEPTPVSEKDEILDAIDRLGPGGSTNLEAGLREGYELAREAFQRNGINRVVLASDGVANAGQTDPDALAAMIRDDADRGIDLVTVGYGMGNFNDVTMEQLADQGDGFYAYIDTIDEAERLFEDELTSTLLTVAKDAKIQVEFDEDIVDSYRLIGFENRGVRDSDFRNDDVDAGELGAAHQVTAIYEIELENGIDVDDREEVGIVQLRWEDPETGDVIEIDEDIDLRDIEPNWRDTSSDFQLATVVVTFAEKLRNNPYADDVDIDDLAEEADRLADDMRTDDVEQLADLVRQAADFS